MDGVNKDVSETFLKQKKIEREIKGLEEQCNSFAKRTSQWLGMVDKFNNSLKVHNSKKTLSMFSLLFIMPKKELGDIENWSKTIETDMNEIAKSLEYVHKNLEN